MIGSYPIGVFPYGRAESEAGVAVVSLGVAEAIASANGATTQVVFRLQPTPAEATAQAIGSNIGLGLGTADASASGVDATLKLLLALGVSEADAQALGAGIQTILAASPAEATAQGLLASTPVTLVTAIADAIAQGNNIASKHLLDLGFASSEAEANDLITKTILETIFATAIASGQIPIPLIRFKIGRAEGVASGNDIVPKVDLTLGNAEAAAEAIDMGGVGLGIFPAEAIVNAQDIVPKTFLDTETGEVVADALVIVPLSKLALAPAEAIVNGLSTDIGIETTEAAAIATALDGDATYFVTDVPDIIVTRSADLTQNVLKVLNDEVGNVNIYRADDHRALFSKIATNQTSPYTDSSLDPEKNFKYKATFVIVGTKGGQSVEVEGPKSDPRYTIGSNTL